MKPITFGEKDLKRLFRSGSPMARFRRWFFRFFKFLVVFVAIYLFFFTLINFQALSKRWAFAFNNQAPLSQRVEPKPTPPIAPEPEPIQFQPEIIIPKIDLRAPIIIDVPFEETIEQLKNGVTHFRDTAYPGEVGNSVIIGHSSDFIWREGNFKTVFALLDKLTAGDEIIVRFGVNEHRYRVVKSQVVSPNELSVLRRTDSPELTLITCYPVGTTRSRLIVHSKLISNTVTGIQKTDPPITESLPRSR